MNEEREEGITFGEIVRLVRRRLWAVLAAAALVTACAVLLTVLVLNPRSVRYGFTFALSSPAAPAQQYADGAPFYYRDVVSEAALAAVLAGDERFAGMDPAQMIENDDVTITSDGGADTMYLGTYTVRVKAGAFPDASAAAAFLRGVAENAARMIRESAENLDYSVQSSAYYAAPLEDRISVLAQLRETLLENYNAWIARYSGAYSVSVNGTGKTLGNYRAEASAPFSAGLQENLSKTCREGGYGQIVLASDASDETVAKAVSLQRAALKEEYERNRKVIEGFQGIQRAGGGSSAGSGVEQYIVRNGVISSQIGNFTVSGEDDGSGTLTAESVKAFSDTLDAQYRALASAAETLKQVTAVIYAENTWASYPARSIVSEGGINPVLAGAAAFVLSFLVAAIVVCTVDYPAHRTKKEQPAQPPALPQTDGAGGEE